MTKCNILCEAYPEHRVEFDASLALVSDLAMRYGGTLFFEYHKCFSAKAELYIQKFIVRLLDLDLVSRVFTGHMPMSSMCGLLAHMVNLCPKTAFAPLIRLLDGLVHEFLAGLCCLPVMSNECHTLQTAGGRRCACQEGSG